MKNPGGPPPHPWVVLIVDDEPDVLDTLKDLVEQSLPGTQVLTASNGREGLEILDAERVDLVMSDFRMPGMDGLEFLFQARRMRPQVPRIMITAFGDNDLAQRAVLEAVVDEFLAKKMSPGDLAGKIEALLRYDPASRRGASGGNNGAVNTPQEFVWREIFSQPFAGSRNFTWKTDGEYGAQIGWVLTPAPGTHGGVTLNIRNSGSGEKHQHLLGDKGKPASTQLGPPGTWKLGFEVANGYQGGIEVTLTSI